MRFLQFIFVLVLCYCEANRFILATDDLTTTVAGSPTTVAGSPTTVAGSPTTVAGSPTTVAGSPTTVAGSPTTVASLTTVTEAPLVLTELPIKNAFVYPTNGARGLLQNILVLRNQVLQLTEELQNLSQDVDPTSSPLLSQIDELSSNAAAMNQTIAALQQRLITLSGVEDTLNQNATVIQSYFTCLSKAGCVTDASTPVLTTTKPPLAACPNPPSTATDSPQDYTQDSLSNVNCSSVIGGSGKVSLTIDSVTIAGTAVLTITDGASGATLANISATTSESKTISGDNLIIYYKASTSSSISFKLSYAKQNLCDGADDMCGPNGKCQVGNGKAYCSCNACFSIGSDQKCSNQQTVCSAREKAKCKDETPVCTMGPDDAGQTCVAKCVADGASIAAWVRKLYR
ncbi:unnamed protein product [Auanema sp. JU1783]|nr:unnamed protein product [Auanema sp. JU1783]